MDCTCQAIINEIKQNVEIMQQVADCAYRKDCDPRSDAYSGACCEILSMIDVVVASWKSAHKKQD